MFGRRALIALILGVFCSFILIVLEPLDTNTYQAPNKTLLLSGYGILLFAFYLLYSQFENLWYLKQGRKWIVRDEAVSILLFLVFFICLAELYRVFFIGTGELIWQKYLSNTFFFLLSFSPIIAPLTVILRQKLGERLSPEEMNTVILEGINKKESLKVTKANLLFVKASENYVEINFISEGAIKQEIFRNTLSSIEAQVPFLKRCHKSYVVNMGAIEAINGNTQRATIQFSNTDLEIPLSKSYYKAFKKALSS